MSKIELKRSLITKAIKKRNRIFYYFYKISTNKRKNKYIKYNKRVDIFSKYLTNIRKEFKKLLVIYKKRKK